jgi:hypothetical protein
VVRLRSPLSTVLAEIIVSTFPQRSLPWLLTTAACGSLGSAPDRRTRRAYLHLSYSYAPPFGPAILVTHGPLRPKRVRRLSGVFRPLRPICTATKSLGLVREPGDLTVDQQPCYACCSGPNERKDFPSNRAVSHSFVGTGPYKKTAAAIPITPSSSSLSTRRKSSAFLFVSFSQNAICSPEKYLPCASGVGGAVFSICPILLLLRLLITASSAKRFAGLT